jgi:hypothetical protein
MKAWLTGIRLYFILHPSSFILKVVDTPRDENIFSNEGPQRFAAGEG